MIDFTTSDNLLQVVTSKSTGHVCSRQKLSSSMDGVFKYWCNYGYMKENIDSTLFPKVMVLCILFTVGFLSCVFYYKWIIFTHTFCSEDNVSLVNFNRWFMERDFSLSSSDCHTWQQSLPHYSSCFVDINNGKS